MLTHIIGLGGKPIVLRGNTGCQGWRAAERAYAEPAGHRFFVRQERLIGRQRVPISDGALQTTTPALDRAIKLILETADALRAVQNGQQKG